MIPGSSVPATDSTCTAVESSQTVIQTDAVREDSANVPSSGKAHGYAKVHKPSPSNGQARTTGPDVVPTIAEVNQTTL